MLADITASFRVVGSWWRSSLCLYAPVFYSQWFLLQQSTLLTSSASHSGCFAAIVLSGGCFAAVVIGLRSGRCFAAECVMAVPPAYALLQWAFWWILGRRGLRWRMLCRRCCFWWIGCHRGIVLFIGNHCAVVSFFTSPVCRFWVSRAVLFFMLL